MGATPGMLRRVYWVQGILLGIVGGFIGAVLLSVLISLVESRLAHGYQLVGPSFVLCTLAGGGLGILGGMAAVGKYLKI
jgi:cell division protein FtsX